ncbi:MAG TPA: hypothetical protein VIB08_06070, partial [Thermoanaerobaculia bacterium]
ETRSSAIGTCRIEAGCRVFESAVWNGVEIGAGATLSRCLAAGGVVPAGTIHEEALLWGRPGEPAAAWPLTPG